MQVPSALKSSAWSSATICTSDCTAVLSKTSSAATIASAASACAACSASVAAVACSSSPLLPTVPGTALPAAVNATIQSCAIAATATRIATGHSCSHSSSYLLVCLNCLPFSACFSFYHNFVNTLFVLCDL